ncbi:hypothetical protein V6B14_21280 [Sporosarcina psychrophila]|uniref:hypothetical protein n=1 Tax=Sporosarcina psychrophila TaxID=1476 RepID=UPI0030CFB876
MDIEKPLLIEMSTMVFLRLLLYGGNKEPISLKKSLLLNDQLHLVQVLKQSTV